MWFYGEVLYVLQGFSAGSLFPGSQLLWFIVAFCLLLFSVDYSLL
jgi:hypothetical protein